MINNDKLYRRIVENAREGICIVAEGERIGFVNQSLADMLGYRVDEMLGHSIFEFIFEEDLEIAKERMEQRKAGDTAPRDFRFRRKDGSEVWASVTTNILYEEDGGFLGLLGMLTDITERRRAEETIRESEERLRLAIDAGQVGTWDWDILNNHVTWSDRTYQFHGVEPGQFGGRVEDFAEMVHPEDRERVRAAIYFAIEDRQPYSTEMRVVRPDGEVVWIATNGQVIYDSQGRAVRMLGATVDITERKRAEAERVELLRREREARKAAETANHMKDEFLATLSHELRTPLNAIIGWSDMLRSRKVEPSLIGQALEVINRNAKFQARLVEDLLDVSRIITGKLQLEVRQVELLSTVNAAIDVVRPAAEAKGIRLEMEYESPAYEVIGDTTRLQQVVWNLLSNAIKFTPRGGKVDVKVQRVDSMVEIVVSDTGQGIKPEFLPYIFDRFSQADNSRTRSHSGLGLGLAIVRYLVELHGGEVEAHSAGEGQGASFTVRLSLAAVRPQEGYFDLGFASVAADGSEAPALNGLKILLVDDNADTREMLSTILAAEGAEVKTSATAREGFESLKEWRPDLFVSDIGLPGEDGYSLIRRVRNLQPEEGGTIPALALTGYVSPEEGEQALKAGFQVHLAKPAEPGKLISVVAGLAGRSSKRKSA
jgi:PAS domain S-box-containing protein